MRRPLRWLAALLLAPLLFVLLYLAAASLLMLWPAGRQSDEPPAVEAYVMSNGVHTDLVFPARSHAFDWTAVFPPGDAPAVPPDAEFIAIGWGDRAFYLDTPTWADLTLRNAVGALFGSQGALLHVTWLRRAQLQGAVWHLPLSAPQYDTLVRHVLDTLPGPQAVPVAGAHYGPEDAFYEARGRYHLLETCNTWTGRGLRRAGVRVSRWTPFDFNVRWHLRPVQRPASLPTAAGTSGTASRAFPRGPG